MAGARRELGHSGPGHSGRGHSGPGHSGPGHSGPGHSGPGHSRPGAANAASPENNLVLAIAPTGRPVIGACNGVAISGGFEVAPAGDMAGIASGFSPACKALTDHGQALDFGAAREARRATAADAAAAAAKATRTSVPERGRRQ